MRKMISAIALAATLTAFGAQAAAKSYQVTGPILEIRNDVIVVQKGKDRWEINRGAAKVSGGDLKVGAKVTIEYTMTATSIDVKAAAAAKKK